MAWLYAHHLLVLPVVLAPLAGIALAAAACKLAAR